MKDQKYWEMLLRNFPTTLDRLGLYENHICVYYADQIQALVEGKKVGEVMMLLAYMTGAMLSQFQSQQIKDYSRMVLNSSRKYERLLKSEGIPLNGPHMNFVVPMIEDWDYSEPPEIENYLTAEEIANNTQDSLEDIKKFIIPGTSTIQ